MKNRLEHKFRRFFVLFPATIGCLSVLILNPKALQINLATQKVEIHAEQVLIEPAAASIAGDSLNQFIQNTQNTIVGLPNDPSDSLKLKGQCVTLSKSFLAFLGLPDPWRTWANDKYSNFSYYSMSLFAQGANSIMDHSGVASDGPYKGKAFTATFISNVEDLQAGDVVATQFMSVYKVSHTGIATGNKDPNRFELYNANWDDGVVSDPQMAHKSWISKSRFYGAIRIRFANEATGGTSNESSNYIAPILQLLSN